MNATTLESVTTSPQQDEPSGPRAGQRRNRRFPIQIEGELSSANVDATQCIIDDFSQHGMGVSVSRRALLGAATSPPLRSGSTVELRFTIPGDGRQARATAVVRHATVQGRRVRLGLWFRQCNPKLLEALLGQTADTAMPIAIPAHAPATRDNVINLDLVSAGTARAGRPARAVPHVEHVEHVRRTCDRFITRASAWLVENLEGTGEHASAYFHGALMLRAQEDNMRAHLERAASRDPLVLRERFRQFVPGLQLSDEVSDLLVSMFDETVAIASEAAPACSVEH